MTFALLALPPEEGIRAYNARLAQIYLDEQAIGGVPINMEGFCLFAPDRRSSLPLRLAYEAAKLSDPENACAFLLRLREATVSECRPTTKHDEIMRVVRLCGINEDAFLAHLEDGSASAALEEDGRYAGRLGIPALPAFLVEGDKHAALIRGIATYETLSSAIGAVAR